jgi:hypothetical protein
VLLRPKEYKIILDFRKNVYIKWYETIDKTIKLPYYKYRIRKETNMLARRFRPMDWDDFKKEIKRQGWQVIPYTKSTHFKIETKTGEKVMDFAVHHKEGGKKYVKPFYVCLFLKEVELRKDEHDE